MDHPQPTPPTFARALIESRKDKNLHQRELADALKVSQQTVSLWEEGRALPTRKRIPALLEFFGPESAMAAFVNTLGNQSIKEKARLDMFAKFAAATPLDGETYTRYKEYITEIKTNDGDPDEAMRTPNELRLELLDELKARLPVEKHRFLDADYRHLPAEVMVDYASPQLVVEVLGRGVVVPKVESAVFSLAALRVVAPELRGARFFVVCVSERAGRMLTYSAAGSRLRRRAGLLNVDVIDVPDVAALCDFIMGHDINPGDE